MARLLLPGEAATLRRRRLVALVTAAFTGDMTLTAPVVLAYSSTAVESGSNQLTLALIGDRLYSDVPARAVPSLVANVQFRRVRIARHAGDVKNGSTCSDDASPTSRRSTTPSRTRSSWPGHNE